MRIKLGPYRKIYTRIWNDEKFNALSDDGKLTFFLLSTHPHLMPIGAMRSTLPGLACELHWVTDRFKNAFDEILIKGMARYDESSSFLWLPNFIKYNFPESPNVVFSWDQYLHYLPECSLRSELVENVRNFAKSYFSTPFQKALPQAFAKAMPNQEQDQKQNHEQKKRKELSGKPDVVCEKDYHTFKNNNHDEKLYRSQAIEILDLLNLKANKVFQHTSYNIGLIVDRLKSGATVMDCRQIVIRKCRLWKGSKKTNEWLRPMTLFNPENFDQYIGELVLPDETQITSN